MIKSIIFIWKQLNGPQVTAFVKALHDWCVSQFSALIDYFNNLSIDTASHTHLSLLGQIANLARPFVSIPDKEFFWFTAEPQKNFNHGFSSLEDRGVGGKFIDIQKLYDTHHGEPLTDTFFRLLLKTYTNSEGEPGSLTLIDDVVDALRKKYGSPSSRYLITIMTTLYTNRDFGDLHIALGKEENWDSWEQVIVSIKAIASTMYAPLPRIFPEYTAKTPSTHPLEASIEGSTLKLTGDEAELQGSKLILTSDNIKLENGKLTINN